MKTPIQIACEQIRSGADLLFKSAKINNKDGCSHCVSQQKLDTSAILQAIALMGAAIEKTINENK